jgi:hypothetical protein
VIDSLEILAPFQLNSLNALFNQKAKVTYDDVFCLFYLSRPVEEAKMDETLSSSSISSCLHPHFPSFKTMFPFPTRFFLF